MSSGWSGPMFILQIANFSDWWETLSIKSLVGSSLYYKIPHFLQMSNYGTALFLVPQNVLTSQKLHVSSCNFHHLQHYYMTFFSHRTYLIELNDRNIFLLRINPTLLYESNHYLVFQHLCMLKMSWLVQIMLLVSVYVHHAMHIINIAKQTNRYWVTHTLSWYGTKIAMIDIRTNSDWPVGRAGNNEPVGLF